MIWHTTRHFCEVSNFMGFNIPPGFQIPLQNGSVLDVMLGYMAGFKILAGFQIPVFHRDDLEAQGDSKARF